MNLTVRPCTEDDIQAVVALNRKNYGDEFFVDPAYFKWRFFSLEYNKSVLLGAFDDQTLTGVTGLFVSPFRINGKVMDVAVTFSSLVDKSYRNALIRDNGSLCTLYSKLLNDAEEYVRNRGVSAIIGFPNENSYPTFIDMAGYRYIGDVDFFMLPLNTSAFLQNHLNLPKYLVQLPAAGLDAVLSIIRNCKRLGKSQYAFSSELDGKCPGTFIKSDFQSIHDKDFLRWRFDSSPTEYRKRIISDSEGVIGYCYWALSEVKDRATNKKYMSVKIADLAFDPNRTDAAAICADLVNSAVLDGKKANAEVLIIGCKAGQDVTALIKRVLPIHMNVILKNNKKMPLIFKWVSETEKEPAMESWHLTMSDNDIV